MTSIMNYSAADTTVMLLAAGHGKRMLPLTESTPKPLLKVGKHSLIEHHLLALNRAGFVNIVINIAYLSEKIKQQLGDGSQFGLQIRYSDEQNTGALETAGGIKNALPLIDSDPFLVINADIYTDFDFTEILQPLDSDGRLILVGNPEHNPNGDFAIQNNSFLGDREQDKDSYTFSGIALYQKALFATLDSGKQPLLPVFKTAIAQQKLEAQVYSGQWCDVGTPERLAQINQR